MVLEWGVGWLVSFRVVLVAGLAVMMLGGSARAATIAVDTTADELNANGNCSLREAVRSANLDTAVDGCAAGSGVDTITVPAGYYRLSLAGSGENEALTGDLDLTGTVTLTGAGEHTTIIDAHGLDRVFELRAPASATLSDMTLTGGKAPGSEDGGGVLARTATLTLERVEVSASTARYGGALSYQGGTGDSLTVRDSAVSSNLASQGGGGMFVGGTATLSNVVLQGNESLNGYGGGMMVNAGPVSATNLVTVGNVAAGGSGAGGGLAIFGDVDLSGGAIAGNSAANTGGGVYALLHKTDLVTISGVDIAGNEATPAGSQGGGLVVVGDHSEPGAPVTLREVTIDGNLAGVGAGLLAFYAAVTVRDSTISDNSTVLAGHNGGGGGGISMVFESTLDLEDSTLSGNVAGSGDGLATASSTKATLVNDTISGNGALGSSAAPGGGIYNGGTVAMTNVTLAENTASAAAGDGGNVYNAGAAGAVTMRDTIVTDALTSGNCGGPMSGASLGHNIERGDSTVCGLTDPTDSVSSESLTMPPATLGPLAFNGGPTQTQALLSGDPAIDAGAGCAATDQRGVPRPQGSACDVGAYEFDTTPPQTTIDSGPGTGPAPVFTFSAGEPAVFACSLDGGAFAACASPLSSPALANGAHTFAVRATDIAGNTDPTPASIQFTLGAAGLTGSTGLGAATGLGTSGSGGLAGGPGASPVLSGLSVSPASFRAARKGASVAVKKSGKTGATVRFTLSEAARVGFTVQRSSSGRRSGGRCVAPTKKLARAKRCTRTVRLSGGFAAAGRAGANSIHFTGRLAGQALRVGSYTLTAQATDGAQRTSATESVKFAILG